MVRNPIELFSNWYQEYLETTHTKLPSSCCLSTIGIDGYPNSRFISLKEVNESGFVITGALTSRKGLEILRCNKVALIFWWAEAERQVRIQGNASLISKQLSDKYFSERNRASQIVSKVSAQGKELLNIDQLNYQYEELSQSSEKIERPQYWGGYLVKPRRIEFLEFKSTRFHDRTLYERSDNDWRKIKLQP